LSLLENLRISGGLAGTPPSAEKILATLKRMGLHGSAMLSAKTLSQGQQRRLALARLLVSDKAVWVLDEPLTALDRAAVSLVQSVLEDHLKGGGIIVLTTHQPLEVEAGKTARINLAPLSEH
jgi:heme exporter protein A